MAEQDHKHATLGDGRFVLTINGGSSSIKFALYSPGTPPVRRLVGAVERIGQPTPQIVAKIDGQPESQIRPIDAANFEHAAEGLISFVNDYAELGALAGIGHRVVHGGLHLTGNPLVTPELIEELHRAEPLDLAHLPREISLIETFGKAFPKLPQVACFDSSFHRDMPKVAQLLPIPRRYLDAGLRRFGFHGLSYTYLMRRLREVAGAEAAEGRVILAHLGSGASMAAVHKGKPIDTTMAFTPTAGLVMGTRPGDIDPGLLAYLIRDQKMTLDQIDNFISSQCGLLGISETSSDMRDLQKRRDTDHRAADAMDLFCYQARKYVGALATTTGGLDTLIFSGGIGEHAPQVRAVICTGFEFLGIELDDDANARTADIISKSSSRVVVRVIATDEEIVIAEAVSAVL